MQTFTIATSIAPFELEKQSAAIESWIQLGFEVVSFNIAREIELLENQFPQVNFLEVMRSGEQQTGKPLVYVNDILNWFKRSQLKYGGFVNSDIILDPPKNICFVEYLKDHITDSLIFSRRIDVQNAHERKGSWWRTGIDAWFFDPKILHVYPENTDYMIGFPHWDYFMELMPICHHVTIKQICFPVAFHPIHKMFYDPVKNGIPYALKTFQHILPYFDQIPDKDHLLVPLLDYFLKNQPKQMITPEETNYYYTFLHLLDKFFLETIDRLSIKLNGDQIASPLLPSNHELHAYHNELFYLTEKFHREITLQFSIIIPTFNRKNILVECLKHIAKQNFNLEDIEVIVCIDGSQDGTKEAVQSANWPFDIKLIEQANQGPAEARNKGIAAAKGDLLLILNDDAFLSENALKIHLEEHQLRNDRKCAVLGNFSMHPEYTDNNKPIGFILNHSDLIFDYYKMNKGEPYNYKYFYTCNISINRKFLMETAIFDPDFYKMGAEDIELGYRLEQKGTQIWYRPDATALHAHNLNPHGIQKMFEFRGRGGVLLFLRHSHLPHHHSEMSPQKIEHFLQMDSQISGLKEQLINSLSKIEEFEFVRNASPVQLNEKERQLHYMWLFSQNIETIEKLLSQMIQTNFKIIKLCESTTEKIPLEHVANTVYPSLVFIKWWHDTLGITQSIYFEKLQEIDGLLTPSTVSL